MQRSITWTDQVRIPKPKPHSLGWTNASLRNAQQKWRRLNGGAQVSRRSAADDDDFKMLDLPIIHIVQINACIR